MFKNEVTHTTSCREASSVMDSSSSGLVYWLHDGGRMQTSWLPSEEPSVLPQNTDRCLVESVPLAEVFVLRVLLMLDFPPGGLRFRTGGSRQLAGYGGQAEGSV